MFHLYDKRFKLQVPSFFPLFIMSYRFFLLYLQTIRKQSYCIMNSIRRWVTAALVIALAGPCAMGDELIEEKMIYSTDFSDWSTVSASTKETTVEQTTKYSNETLVFTLYDTSVNPAGTNSKFNDGEPLGWLQAAKSDDPYVLTSALNSITKVRFVHGATGSNRGWMLEALGDGDEDWVTISSSVASPASWCEVNVDVDRTNVQLRFTNLNSSQNAYMFELDIYGNVDYSSTPVIESFALNGVTYDAEDLFEASDDGTYEATVQIAKTETMISADNPLTDITMKNGTLTSTSYDLADDGSSCAVTMVATLDEETRTYVLTVAYYEDCTLAYTDTDGSLIGTQIVQKYSTIGEFAYGASDVTVPSDGEFLGWYDAAEDGNEITTDYEVTEDILVLYAVCSGTVEEEADDDDGTVSEEQPAFPGAEGFGKYTTGGRGGTVYHVTTLEDTGTEGSFRYACAQTGTRTIVFDVSGTIYLTSELKLSSGNVTIAGQTAPGDGICIADYPFTISADNVIIRYVRFRLGNRHVDDHEGDGLGGMDRENIVIDHCSISWSVDECLSVYGSWDITIQWCLVSQSMVNCGHSKGAHGYGGNWGGSGATYHHNLLMHHTSRTPRLGPRPGTQTDERMDLRNNVIYNWAGNGCYGGEGMNVNIVNNYYKVGPATTSRSTTIQRRIASIGIRTTDYTDHDTDSPNSWDVMWHVWGKYYVDGNVNSKYDDVTEDNWTYGMYNQITNSDVDYTYTQETKDTMKLDDPIDFVAVTTHSAEDAYEKVVQYAGCCLSRDSYDEVMIYDATEGAATYTGDDCSSGMINSQDDCGGWPDLESTEAPADTDGDGMPDDWEIENNLNPYIASDGAKTAANGYTNLENYMNSLVADITEAQSEGGTVMGYTVNTDGTTDTAIKELRNDGTRLAGDYRIFTVDGRFVGYDWETLGRGVYIINHKKYIVQ